jgi:hypothetical protein
MASKKQKDSPLRVVELDVLKPHKPTILELGKAICEHKSVNNVNIDVYAIDEKTESIRIILDGRNVDYESIESIIENHGAVVHSIDKVVLGSKKPIEVPKTEK